jgi:cell fate regulator YaaT (PSP1 superfamily)
MSCTTCQLNKSANAGVANRIDMLTNYDWLNDLPDTSTQSDIVEVRFKGTRKEFVKNENNIAVKRGDVVVISAQGGHDVGIVSLTGKLARMQYDRKVKSMSRHQWFTIYRIATENDNQRWMESQQREKAVMIEARKISERLGLSMKIGDVEFRGDGQKAIFYYIADGRVDFRQLIKEYAAEFRIKIEMKQIGARQEAARIGGIGSCGRELCCSSWRTDFTSITAHSAIQQGLSPNAEKLTGRCGKLKCCLMYELDTYLEAQADFPKELLILETVNGLAKPINTDILTKKITYMVDGKIRQSLVLTLDKVKEVIQLNKRGIKPDLLTLTEINNQKKEDEKNMFNKNLISNQKLVENRRNSNRRYRIKPEQQKKETIGSDRKQ